MRVTNCDIHKCLVFITCYLVMFMHIGLFYSIGTIFVDVMSTFNTSRAETAVIHSTAMGVVFGTGLISGVVIHKFGIIICGIAGGLLASSGLVGCFFAASTVHMTISYGIVHAFGLGCIYICSATAIGQHFEGKRKLLMLSLQASGVALGGMMYPYILAFLSDLYGFRGALLIIGGLTMNCIPGCLLWKQPTLKKETRIENLNSERMRVYQQDLQTRVITGGDTITIEKNTDDPENKDNDIFYIKNFPVLHGDSKTRKIWFNQGDNTTASTTDDTEGPQTLLQSIKYILRNKSFVIFTIGCIVANPAIGITVIFVADVFDEKGLSVSDVTFGLLLMNIVNLCGRLLPGAMMQSKHIPTLFCPLFASLVSTLVLIGFSLSSSRSFTIGVLAVTGIPLGMFITMFSVISAKLVGVQNLPTAIGIIFSANGIGNAIAGPVSGYIRDKSGSYTVPFYAAAGITMFATLLFLITLVTHKLQANKQKHVLPVYYLTSM